MPMRVLLLLLSSMLLVLAGCSTPVQLDQPAPIVKYNVAQSAADAAQPSGPYAAHFGEHGYYMVQHGDSLGRVARRFSCSVHDLLRWNPIENPNRIEVGLVLRVSPPPQPASPVAVAQPLDEGAPAVVPTPAPRAAAAPVTRPAGQPTARVASKPAANAVKPTSAPTAHAPASTAPAAATAVAGGWLRPVPGAVLQGFNGSTSQGIDFAGKLGDPVLAAAPGKVVYAGSELRGYGNLVIVKHANNYLSVYAHNAKLLVKDGQAVQRGQQIATMGSSDASRVELHFEIRLQGKPIDPQQLLPH